MNHEAMEALNAIVERAANSIQGPRVPGLRFLWAIGLKGSVEDFEKLEGAIRSAVQSELESFAKANKP
jgi:hypothetical protein